MNEKEPLIERDEIKRSIARCFLNNYIGIEPPPLALSKSTQEKISDSQYISGICAKIFSERSKDTRQHWFQRDFSAIARENSLIPTPEESDQMSDEKFYELAGERVLQKAIQLGILKQGDHYITYQPGLEEKI